MTSPHNYSKNEVDELKARLAEYERLLETAVGANAMWKRLHDEAQARLAEAVERIKDMLQGDDGQAWKEARRFLEKIGATDSAPAFYVDPDPQVTYAHKTDPTGVRFRQYKKDPLPPWAVDVRDEP